MPTTSSEPSHRRLAGEILSQLLKVLQFPAVIFDQRMGQNLPFFVQLFIESHLIAHLLRLKLECLKIKRRLNHFSLQVLLYLKANHVAFEELQILKAA
jgi:hypothetical protein